MRSQSVPGLFLGEMASPRSLRQACWLINAGHSRGISGKISVNLSAGVVDIYPVRISFTCSGRLPQTSGLVMAVLTTVVDD